MKIVIVGSAGRLGTMLMRDYQKKHEVVGFNRPELDLADCDAIRKKLGAINFDVLINAAAFTNVDACETERDRAFLINCEAPGVLAEICNDRDAKLIHFSTDYVFDGDKHAPYTEKDQANPISVYGESKLAGEQNVLAAGSDHLVLRVSWVFGPDRPSFIDAMIKRAQQEEKIDAISDKISTPTYTYDVAAMLPQFFDRVAEGGILHFANAGKCSWQEYAQWALDCCRDAGVPLKARTVGALKLSDMTNWAARRPVYSVLSTGKYTELTGAAPRAWREAVVDYITRFYSKK
ncbi:MAG TPA: dTDP-4-dehydrorhamnose reductase [Candidatus Udaeobacter sp.]|jgi:dTDP-4-dehydrorhamnose reductase|nr:dTDP-4-dehydrorhamnose reductase [Candidatus Udaeobacter sp.]